MNAESVDWGSALVVAAIGLVLGAFFVWRVRRARQAAPHVAAAPVALRDLFGRRDALLGQLRELDDTATALAPTQLAAERGELELELARVLKALDEQGQASGAKGATPSPARAAEGVPQAAASGAGAGLKGFLWGLASMAALGGLFLWVSRSAEPREEGGSVTGRPGMGAPAPAPAAEATPEPSRAELQSRAALERNPQDLEARVALARELLGRGDMMGVWNETQEILKRKPDESRALSYQALVRLAMGQADVALEMLQRALKADPDQVDVYTHLAFVYLNVGRGADAEAIMATARKRFPEEAPRLTEVFGQMKERVQARNASLPAGEENPHAKLAPATAPTAPTPTATAPQADPKRRVVGVIELDASAAARVQSGATLFLMARPAGQTSGPPAGVKRLVVGSFPLAFELSDGDSMDGTPLPDSLRLDARLDADGDAATKDPNDPKGALESVALGASGLRLLLK